MDTQQTVEAARALLTAATPSLWIRLSDRRTVAAVKALPAGVDPNPEGGAFKAWILVGDGFALADAELERAILMKRSGQPRPRADDTDGSRPPGAPACEAARLEGPMGFLLRGKQVSDFRSDTVTRPTPAMRRAMAEAVVGDDVFEDDPTVVELETRAARLFGKEAGLFVPTGTMGNLIAMTCHTSPGDEVLVEALSHAYNNEAGGAARFAGVLTRTLDSDRGLLDPELVRRLARKESLHSPRTALLVVENTHNFWGGRIVPLAHMDALWRAAREKGVALHVDGARIFNAIVATGTTPADWGARCDSIQLCLSKGLGAPVGSLVLGTRDLIVRARRVRKTLGGGMRQVGVLAAPGLVALEEGPKHLAADHARARRLVDALAGIGGCLVDRAACETNIVFVRTTGGPGAYPALVAGLEAKGVLAAALGDLGIRFVTHRDVDDADVEEAIAALRELVPAAVARV